jgi:hypothetical protein
MKEAVRYNASGGDPDPPGRNPVLQPHNPCGAETDRIMAFLDSLTGTEAWVTDKAP